MAISQAQRSMIWFIDYRNDNAWIGDSVNLTNSQMPFKGWRLIVKTEVKVRCNNNDLNTYNNLGGSRTSVQQTCQIFKSATHVTVHVNIFQLCNNYIHLQVISWLHCSRLTLTIKVQYHKRKYKNQNKNKSSCLIRNGAWVIQIKIFFKIIKGHRLFL